MQAGRAVGRSKMSHWYSWRVAVAASLLLAACQGTLAAPREVNPRPQASTEEAKQLGATPSLGADGGGWPVIVTGDAPNLPAGCTPLEVTHLIVGFVDAFNRGDWDQVAKYFGPDFQWFNEQFPLNEEIQQFLANARSGTRLVFPEGVPPGLRLEGPEELLPYLAERRARGQRMEILSINVTRSWHPGVDLGALVRRTANDLPLGPEPAPDLVHATGSIHNCQQQTITLWVMGYRWPGVHPRSLCPDPPTPAPPRAVIACATDR